ncbi:SGNH/GDSL hydrolase family protein [Catellatospora sichuanensis]|uniref:SGNH/GDSL hydrolase family protein n=1 Tax=Catellatospora sichuanensis TaxID=1969805 RepID=UPI001183D2CD|nr:GDSL-type esterase/lipase family protein [Catellatospora sichuanensis]
MKRRTALGGPIAAPHGSLAAGAAKEIVCVGDSITRGLASADYVSLLRDRLGPTGYRFVNAGVDGNLAWNVRGRLDEVIACRPDAVTLLVGTNDVNATYDARWARHYRRQQRLPAPPSLEWYRENVDAILDRLQNGTSARLAVLDLPPLGEDLSSTMNQQVREYNTALREIAEGRGVPCLPLHERLTTMLPPGHRPPPYEGRLGLALRTTFQHLVLRRSWNEISAANGLALLTDHIHLNDTAAAVIADLISEWLQTSVPRRN